jgi:hypothetical protein
MGTKNDPGEFDCYKHAMPDEPIFVLLARDPLAANIVREWADRLAILIKLGRKPETDKPKIAEAQQCAHAMENWRIENYGAWRNPLYRGAVMLHPAMHASVPEDGVCGQCATDNEPCALCYMTWWSGKHPRRCDFLRRLGIES